MWIAEFGCCSNMSDRRVLRQLNARQKITSQRSHLGARTMVVAEAGRRVGKAAVQTSGLERRSCKWCKLRIDCVCQPCLLRLFPNVNCLVTLPHDGAFYLGSFGQRTYGTRG